MNLVFSGPSGSGKGSITEQLLRNINYKKFITCTTREPRTGEKNGYDYYFFSEKDFLSKVQLNEMFNVKKYGENYYGSFEKDIDNILTDRNVIFQLTPDRALEMKKQNTDTCLILVIPPSAEVLSERRENRSNERIENDIQNLIIAKEFDYVVVADNLETACIQVEDCVQKFKTGSNSPFSLKKNIALVESLISDLKNYITKEDNIKTIFDGDVAKKWDEKSLYVNYYGIKNPINNEIFSTIQNGMRIADIGCGTGKTLCKLDKKYTGCTFTGLDISSDMISVARRKGITGNNSIDYINADFMNHTFANKFDIITFSYVLHHMKDPLLALKKAKYLLTDNGKIIFSVPGKEYLAEVFDDDSAIGRFGMPEIDEMLEETGLFPLTANRNRFMMQFNSYEMFQKYLKSIGTYQKINGYTNDEWDSNFNEEILEKFDKNKYISGEYLTYNCEKKSKILLRR